MLSSKIEVRSSEYYNEPKYYRFMPRSIFDALENSVLTSVERYDQITCLVPESDFLRMINEIQLNNGSKDN
jgi:hypothetical protein